MSLKKRGNGECNWVRIIHWHWINMSLKKIMVGSNPQCFNPLKKYSSGKKSKYFSEKSEGMQTMEMKAWKGFIFCEFKQ